jgi:uncharacterized membrane protein
MATQAEAGSDHKTKAPKEQQLWGYKPSWFDYLLSALSLALVAAVALAIYGGWEQMSLFPATYFIHFGTILIMLALNPIILLSEKGTPRHRLIGKLWLVSMVATAIVSFFIRDINDGGFSPIHILSVFALLGSWGIYSSARKGNHKRHRLHVYNLVVGALLIAGFFTFQFDRLFDRWLGMALG